MTATERRTALWEGPLSDVRRAELAQIAPSFDFHEVADKADLEARIGDAEIVAGSVPESALPRAARLKWVHSWAAGPNTQLYPAMVESPVVVTCSKGNGAIPLAEHALMLMLMLNRDAMRWVEGQREKRWDHFTHGELTGLTCGIVGAGHSGRDLALKAKACHMRVIGIRRHLGDEANFDEMLPLDRLHDFLAQSDFVVMTAPLTPETEAMLGEAEFRAMKQSAFYICFSRGGIAKDEALLRALNEGWIAGAGLDAHGTEPLPPDSPFWDRAQHDRHAAQRRLIG